MRNYDEVTNHLLERRDRYLAEQKRKRKKHMGVAISLSCFCMVFLLGFGAWNSGILSPASTPNTPEQAIGDAQYPGVNDAVDDKIVINHIKAISSDRMNICLIVDDFVEMSREEMIDYYGVDYIPDVPADIKPWEDQCCGIFKRNGGTGEVYWDRDILNFSNEDFTRSVSIEVEKGSIPWVDYLHLSANEEKSVINNVEVFIGQSENGYYYTEFMYKDVGFAMVAEGVSQDEFIAIIASIIK